MSADGANVLAPPPLIFVAGLAAGLTLAAALPDTPIPLAVRLPLGGAFLLGGLALLWSFVREFHRAGTAVRPDHPATALVTTGPYRRTRNPGYLGMAAIFVGIVLLAQALWALPFLVITIAVVDRGVIAREERYLQQRFGETYGEYRRRVRRWL